jgi:hypothetical protein
VPDGKILAVPIFDEFPLKHNSLVKIFEQAKRWATPSVAQEASLLPAPECHANGQCRHTKKIVSSQRLFIFPVYVHRAIPADDLDLDRIQVLAIKRPTYEPGLPIAVASSGH